MSKAVTRKSPGKSRAKLIGTAHDDKRQEIIERCAHLFDGGSYHRSTMQMLVALAPIHRRAGIERMVVATYQSVSGTGKKAVDELDAQSRAEKS